MIFSTDQPRFFGHPNLFHQATVEVVVVVVVVEVTVLVDVVVVDSAAVSTMELGRN